MEKGVRVLTTPSVIQQVVFDSARTALEFFTILHYMEIYNKKGGEDGFFEIAAPPVDGWFATTFHVGLQLTVDSWGGGSDRSDE